MWGGRLFLCGGRRTLRGLRAIRKIVRGTVFPHACAQAGTKTQGVWVAKHARREAAVSPRLHHSFSRPVRNNQKAADGQPLLAISRFRLS